MKRVFRKLAKVVELLKGNDNTARAALINVATNNGRLKILKRSIKQLIPIEVTSSEGTGLDASSELLVGPTVDDGKNGNITNQSAHPTQPHRAAAVLGEAIQRNWIGF